MSWNFIVIYVETSGVEVHKDYVHSYKTLVWQLLSSRCNVTAIPPWSLVQYSQYAFIVVTETQTPKKPQTACVIPDFLGIWGFGIRSFLVLTHFFDFGGVYHHYWSCITFSGAL